MKRLALTVGLMVSLLSAAMAIASTGATATATLIDSAGEVMGTATFTQLGGDKVRVDVYATGLTPGKHGLHIHSVGSCVAPSFTSAGGHFNPAGHQHGRKSELGPHAGDLRNLVAGQDGVGRLHQVTDLVSLGDTASSLFDGNGSALVIHAGEDDETTDPTGNSGARVACGAIRG